MLLELDLSWIRSRHILGLPLKVRHPCRLREPADADLNHVPIRLLLDYFHLPPTSILVLFYPGRAIILLAHRSISPGTFVYSSVAGEELRSLTSHFTVPLHRPCLAVSDCRRRTPRHKLLPFDFREGVGCFWSTCNLQSSAGHLGSTLRPFSNSSPPHATITVHLVPQHVCRN